MRKLVLLLLSAALTLSMAGTPHSQLVEPEDVTSYFPANQVSTEVRGTPAIAQKSAASNGSRLGETCSSDFLVRGNIGFGESEWNGLSQPNRVIQNESELSNGPQPTWSASQDGNVASLRYSIGEPPAQNIKGCWLDGHINHETQFSEGTLNYNITEHKYSRYMYCGVNIHHWTASAFIEVFALGAPGTPFTFDCVLGGTDPGEFVHGAASFSATIRVYNAGQSFIDIVQADLPFSTIISGQTDNEVITHEGETYSRAYILAASSAYGVGYSHVIMCPIVLWETLVYDLNVQISDFSAPPVAAFTGPEVVEEVPFMPEEYIPSVYEDICCDKILRFESISTVPGGGEINWYRWKLTPPDGGDPIIYESANDETLILKLEGRAGLVGSHIMELIVFSNSGGSDCWSTSYDVLAPKALVVTGPDGGLEAATRVMETKVQAALRGKGWRVEHLPNPTKDELELSLADPCVRGFVLLGHSTVPLDYVCWYDRDYDGFSGWVHETLLELIWGNTPSCCGPRDCLPRYNADTRLYPADVQAIIGDRDFCFVSIMMCMVDHELWEQTFNSQCYKTPMSTEGDFRNVVRPNHEAKYPQVLWDNWVCAPCCGVVPLEKSNGIPEFAAPNIEEEMNVEADDCGAIYYCDSTGMCGNGFYPILGCVLDFVLDTSGMVVISDIDSSFSIIATSDIISTDSLVLFGELIEISIPVLDSIERKLRFLSFSVSPFSGEEMNSTYEVEVKYADLGEPGSGAHDISSLDVYFVSNEDIVGFQPIPFDIDTLTKTISFNTSFSGTAALLNKDDWLHCGDIDGSGGSPNPVDFAVFVNYIFRQGPPPAGPWFGDVDCSGAVNAVDLIWMVHFTFRNQSLPCESCL